jgi:hypothetical protein
MDERERIEEIARANAAVAAAQDRSYWLDRWHVDLNAVMRRRGASELRALVRALRAVYRLLSDARRELRKAAGQAPEKLAATRRGLAQEQERAEAMGAAGSARGEPAIRRALIEAGLEPRPGDPWLRGAAGGPSPLDQLDAVRAGLAPDARVVLEADGLAPATLLARSTPDWRIALYVEGDPDVYVLEPR